MIRWSVFILKYQRIYASYSQGLILYIYRLKIWSNFNPSPNCKWMTFPIPWWSWPWTFLCVNLLHLLFMWLTVSFLSQYNLHLLLLLLSSLCYSFWVFHISVSWWSFIGVWVTSTLIKSTRLILVFWPILTKR